MKTVPHPVPFVIDWARVGGLEIVLASSARDVRFVSRVKPKTLKFEDFKRKKGGIRIMCLSCASLHAEPKRL